MKPYTFYLIGLLTLGALTSCSDDDVLSGETDPRSSYFMPDEQDTSAEAELRKQFFAKEGSYLLFNDTLRYEPLGVDRYGETQYLLEKLDLDYVIGGVRSSKKYHFVFLNTDREKQDAVKFLQAYVLPHLSTRLRPYSWFVLKTLTEEFLNDLTDLKTFAGERTIAIALGDISTATDDEKLSLSREILTTVVGNILSGVDKPMTPFYEPGNGFYGNYFDYETDEDNMETLLQHGFLVRGLSIWFNSEANGIYPNQAQDVTSYVKLCLSSTPEEVHRQYADYPLVLKKFEIINTLIYQLGYIPE